MNARANLITATLTLALIIPAAASASSRNIPWDATLVQQTVPQRYVLKANSSTIGLGAYSNWAAYVRGGSSQKVAEAITAAAKTPTGNPCLSTAQHRVPC